MASDAKTRLKVYFDNTAIIRELDIIIMRKKGEVEELLRQNSNICRDLKEYYIVKETNNGQEYFTFEENDYNLKEDFVIEDNRVIKLKDEGKKNNQSYLESLEESNVYKNFQKINKNLEDHFQNNEKIKDLEDSIDEYETDKEIVKKTNVDRILDPAVEVYEYLHNTTKEIVVKNFEAIEEARKRYEMLENKGSSLTLKAEYKEEFKTVQEWGRAKFVNMENVDEAIIYSIRNVIPVITKVYTEFLVEKIKEGKDKKNIEDQGHLNDLNVSINETTNMRVSVMNSTPWETHLKELKLPQDLKHIRN